MFRAAVSEHYLTMASSSVPFEEDEKDPSVWFLDHNYVENMNDMFKKVNAKEKLIGWYHSGPKLRASDLEINDLFKRYTPNPLLVIIDVQPKEAGVPTDAYFAVDEIKDVSGLSGQGSGTKKRHVANNCARLDRMALPHREPSYTPLPSSKQRRPKKSAWNTCSAISATSLSVPSRPG